MDARAKPVNGYEHLSNIAALRFTQWEGQEAVMTLFIAGLLIYNFNMDWWWYGIAAGIWLYRAYALEDVSGKMMCRYKSN